MNIVEKHTNVFSFFKVKDSLILIERDEMTREQISEIIGTQKKMKTQFLRNCGDYLYDLGVDKILIYDSEFNYLYDIGKKGISLDNTSVDFLDDEILIISQSIWDDNYNLVSYFNYYERKNKKEEDIYCGRFLNTQFRINFIYEERYSPKYFRLSNLLDTENYFEFKCEDGYELLINFYFWNNSLIFMYCKDTDLIFEQKELITGKTIWKTHIADGTFCFDEERGLMVSIWGNSGKYSESKDQYQIINLHTQTVEIGAPQKSFDFLNVESHMGTALYKNKLYFSDNPFSYANEEPKPIYVGCFDIETKKVDFIHAIPEMAGSQVSQIIYNNKKLYVRSSNGDLIVYEI